MKKTLTLFCLVFMSCTHTPILETGPDDPSHWMAGDDQVAYVKRYNRDLASKKITTYQTKGTCDGLPRIDIKTAPGFCVGLVFDGSKVFHKVRWSAPMGEKKIALVEMGGWALFNGRIYSLDYSKSPAQLSEILNPQSFSSKDPRRGILDRPNQILKHTDGLYYVGGATGLYRFNPLAANPAQTVEVMISDLPAVGLHPLKSFAFDGRGSLFINVGSASNVCQNFTSFGSRDPKINPRNFQGKQFSTCPEVESLQIGQAQVRRYTVLADGRLSKDFEVFGKGLRNSIGLLWDEKHQVLLQTENGRDAINKASQEFSNESYPVEEINILERGQHYGWPYCHGANLNNPEWKNVDCSKMKKPLVELPAHSAPLGMMYHSGKNWPAWYQGRLLIALHGYAPKGHRIVAMKRNDEGLPTGIPQSLVFGWDEKGNQGVGKPVSMLELEDGSVLIVEDEDQNKILRLVYDPTLGPGNPVQEIDQKTSPAVQDQNETELKAKFEESLKTKALDPFVQFQAKVIQKYCVECHQEAGSPGVRLIKYDLAGNAERIRSSGKMDVIQAVLRGEPNVPPMPPQGWESPEEQKQANELFQKWRNQK